MHTFLRLDPTAMLLLGAVETCEPASYLPPLHPRPGIIWRVRCAVIGRLMNPPWYMRQCCSLRAVLNDPSWSAKLSKADLRYLV
ncbi:hypothetical protein F5884DRAFT_791141 [Xylogone sp. PMI_703]|nr:hypothetical protein F5884DRAFT_791141 [Xylogone sp. PMI_703]